MFETEKFFDSLEKNSEKHPCAKMLENLKISTYIPGRAQKKFEILYQKQLKSCKNISKVFLENQKIINAPFCE